VNPAVPGVVTGAFTIGGAIVGGVVQWVGGGVGARRQQSAERAAQIAELHAVVVKLANEVIFWQDRGGERENSDAVRSEITPHLADVARLVALVSTSDTLEHAAGAVNDAAASVLAALLRPSEFEPAQEELHRALEKLRRARIAESGALVLRWRHRRRYWRAGSAGGG
jgi:sulfite reductase beta subunit-like hemoprotein